MIPWFPCHLGHRSTSLTQKTPLWLVLFLTLSRVVYEETKDFDVRDLESDSLQTGNENKDQNEQCQPARTWIQALSYIVKKLTLYGDNNPHELSSNANVHFMDVELQEAEVNQLAVLPSLTQYILFFIVLGMLLGRIGERE